MTALFLASATALFLAANTVPTGEPGNTDVAASGGDEGFDWIVPANSTFFFNTDFQLLIDNQHGLVQLVQGGLLVVDDLSIGEGARVKVFGSSPLRILATGTVQVDGEIDVSGADAQNVQSLNLAQVPQSGGAGGPGGGDGGDGSPETQMSSAQGGTGLGPMGLAASGGRGGESGYTGDFNRNLRRAAGGGGGRFASFASDPALLAQPGEPGMDSTPAEFDPPFFTGEGAFGAMSGSIPPMPGGIGDSPFVDGSSRNDFWGLKLRGGEVLAGELTQLSAGSGGGAGGDAILSSVFPSPQFVNSSGLTVNDFKGGSGGGGGGAFQIVALGPIVFGPGGRLLGDGGSGGTGESTFFIDRIGGGGGGGSGGHVILEANRIEIFEPEATTEGKHAVISALGGVGGSGMPIGDNAEGTSEFNEIFLVIDGFINDGGAGGPGVIQLHVPVSSDGSVDRNLILPDGFSLEGLTVPSAEVLLPLFLPQVAE